MKETIYILYFERGYTMRPNSEKLIKHLLESQPKTSNQLAELLQVSVRSIKNYAKEINEEYPNLLTSSNEGYSVNINQALSLFNTSNEHIPQTSQERVFYIINKLIHHNTGKDEKINHSLDLYELCDELYISMSTLKVELNKVKRKLKKYDLELETKSDSIKCIGLEKNKRKLLSSILYKESNVNFVNIDSLQKAFTNIDIHYIRSTVLEIFDKYHYFVNDYSLINLILHITIAVDRIRNNNINTTKVDTLPAVRLHEYEMSKELAKRLEEKFDIQYSDAEIYEMTLLIISRATNIDYQSIDANNLEQFVGKECLELVKELINDINAFYYIDLSEQEFLIRFALHIKNLLVRSKNNYFSKNPLTESIKLSCPLIYDASVNLARTIKSKTGISINDDEIAYIAFHLGSALETQKNLTSKVKAVLYCPNYYGINSRITDAIYNDFENDLLITNILTDESQIDKVNDIDLVITTIPLATPIQIPTIRINIILNDRDISNLRNRISEIQTQKKKNEFEKHLKELLSPELFERKNNLDTHEKCINYMVKKLVKLDYVDTHFKDEVLEREKMSSTAFGNFAIPHAMKMHANKTGINILISENPISWNEHPVNLVIMMCFNKNERYIFNEIYDPITMILSEPENVKKILHATDYDDFIKIMVSLL